MKKKCAVITIGDSRDDYYETRKAAANAYLAKLKVLEQYADCLFTPVLRSSEEIRRTMEEAERFSPQAIIIHIPIWADPALALDVALLSSLPLLLLGNTDPTTSSLVGLLGAGGALDQIGRRHQRVLGLENGGEASVAAFMDACAAAAALRGQEMLRIGDSPLGIVTATPDNLLWLRDFGVKIRQIDEGLVLERAEKIAAERVAQQRGWLEARFSSIRFGNGFTEEVLERQIRSYLALKDLSEESRAALIGLRCQPSFSNGYCNQCLSHVLLNAEEDGCGEKEAVVCSCESDANGALTMYVMSLLSGTPASLMDIRRVDEKQGLFLLANCGGMPLAHYRPGENGCGVRMMRHAFGLSCAGACSGELRTGPVTMARLCVENGRHWMAVLRGESLEMDAATRAGAPEQFPTALIRTEPLKDFLRVYGSNHIHIVLGDISEKLIAFCWEKGIECRVW